MFSLPLLTPFMPGKNRENQPNFFLDKKTGHRYNRTQFSLRPLRFSGIRQVTNLKILKMFHARKYGSVFIHSQGKMHMNATIEELLSKRVKKARHRRGLTLAQFSQQTKISVATLSKIENAKISSPVSTYAKIAKALDIPLGELFSESIPIPISFVTREERKIFTHSPGYTGESIAFKKPSKKMEPFVFTYLRGGRTPSPYQHDNEELIFVIEGELEFRYGSGKYILKPGDCVYFDASIKHSARTLGDKGAQALVVEA